jgi:hypothetical protein
MNVRQRPNCGACGNPMLRSELRVPERAPASAAATDVTYRRLTTWWCSQCGRQQPRVD